MNVRKERCRACRYWGNDPWNGDYTEAPCRILKGPKAGQVRDHNDQACKDFFLIPELQNLLGVSHDKRA